MADTKISALPASTTPLAGTEVVPVVQSGTTKQVSVANLTAGRDVATKNITAGTTSVGNTQVSVQASASNDANEPEFNLYSAVFANLNKPRVKSANGTLALLVESGSTSTFQKRARLRLDGGGGANATIQTSTDNGATYTDQLTVAGATGDVTVKTGNLVIGTSGKGIDFSADSHAAGMTSELLDDYEEGTWTPTLSGDGGSAGSLAYTSSGKYVKVGRQVTITGGIQLSALGSFTGRIRIGGVPYSATIGASYGALDLGAFTTAYTYYNVAISLGSAAYTEATINCSISGSGGIELNWSEASASSRINFTITYQVA